MDKLFTVLHARILVPAARGVLAILETKKRTREDFEDSDRSDGGSSSKKPIGDVPESSNGGSASKKRSEVICLDCDEVASQGIGFLCSKCYQDRDRRLDFDNPFKSGQKPNVFFWEKNKKAKSEKAEPNQVPQTNRWQRAVKCIRKCSDCDRRFATEDAPCDLHLPEYTCNYCYGSCESEVGERCKPCQKIVYGITDVFRPFSIKTVIARDGHAAVRLLKTQDGYNYRLEFPVDSVESFDKSNFQEEPMLECLNEDAKNLLYIYGMDEDDPLGTQTFVFKVKEDVTIEFFLEGLETGRPVRPVVTVKVKKEPTSK